MNAQFFVFTHKDCPLPTGPLFQPIGLGGFRSERVTQTDRDAPGNISHLNRHYCELTGIHHVWKSTRQDVVGLAHYRRYLNLAPLSGNDRRVRGILTAPPGDLLDQVLSHPYQSARAEEILADYDLIVPYAEYAHDSVGEHFVAQGGGAVWGPFLHQLDALYGPRVHSMRLERRGFYCNIFICKRKLFELYCEQLFPVIDAVFAELGPDGMTEGNEPHRYPGYLAERFMPAFINANGLKYYEADVVFTG